MNKVNDPEVNKIVSCGKSGKKMFHAPHKVDMRACYAKQKINLACPKPYFFVVFSSNLLKNAAPNNIFVLCLMKATKA